MADQEEKQFDEILKSLNTKEAIPTDKFKNKLKAEMIKEFKKGQPNNGFSLADWYLNFLSLVLVVISISLVAYFGVLYNTNSGTTTGSTVVLTDLDKEEILEKYNKNNPETLTRKREAPLVSFPESQKSSNYFSTLKNQTFGNGYFRCTDSFLIVNQTILEETFYVQDTTLAKEVVRNGVGDLISEKVVTYTLDKRITEEYRGGNYIVVNSEEFDYDDSVSSTAATVTPVTRDGEEAFEIEYRAFLDCNGTKEQLITVQYINAVTFKVESEEVYLGTKTENNLYSITTIDTSERNINPSERIEIFNLDHPVAREIVGDPEDLVETIAYLVPVSMVEGVSYRPTNIVSDISNIHYIDSKFYPESEWGRDLLEHTVKILGNPSLSYDIQLSPFEFAKVNLYARSFEEESNSQERTARISISGGEVIATFRLAPVSFGVNSMNEISFEYNSNYYVIETPDVDLFSTLGNFNI